MYENKKCDLCNNKENFGNDIRFGIHNRYEEYNAYIFDILKNYNYLCDDCLINLLEKYLINYVESKLLNCPICNSKPEIEIQEGKRRKLFPHEVKMRLYSDRYIYAIYLRIIRCENRHLPLLIERGRSHTKNFIKDADNKIEIWNKSARCKL